MRKYVLLPHHQYKAIEESTDEEKTQTPRKGDLETETNFPK